MGQIEAIKDTESSNRGTVLALQLRKIIQVSQSLLKTLLASFLAVTTHSMGTERVVSHYNQIKREDRALYINIKLEAMHNILQISLNRKGTVYFDPSEAVANFLKNRRNSHADTELFKTRKYMKKF